MRECKIGVGGCGGNLYKTFLDYANELVGPVLMHNLLWGYEKELVSRESEWKSLFAGLLVDLDLDEVEGLKPIQAIDINEDYYDGYYYLYGNRGWDKLPEELEDKMLRAIGYGMEDPGFIHRPELQMISFAVSGVGEHICKKMYENIKKVEFDSLFFFVGLGGGTGTGVISNITGYIRIEGKKTYPSFVLAALTGKNDGRIMRTQASFYRRSFNAIWALNDLLAGKKIDCVILVDNDKVPEIEEVKKEMGKAENEENKGDPLNRYIIRSIFPLLGKNEFEIIDESEWQREMAVSGFKPILIPCFWHGKLKLEELIKNAIEKGKLADCDHKTADAAYVITKGFWDDRKKIEGIVREGLGAAGVAVDGLKVWRTRKTGGDHKDKEILILLKNPGIKELLPERIEAAITFIKLVQNNSDEVAIKKVRETASKFLKGQYLGDYVQRVRDEAYEFLHIGDPFKFTEEAIEGKRRFIDDFKKELEEVKNRIENGEQEIFRENVKIELGYLFSLDAEFADVLKYGVISEELKTIFEGKGFPLEDVNEVTKSGDEWEMRDENKKNKFIVRLDEGELKVYTSEAGKVWKSINWLEVEQMVEKKFELMGVKRETGRFGNLWEEIKRLEEEKASSEEIEVLKHKIGEFWKEMPASELEDIRENIERLGKERGAPPEEINKLNKRINSLEEEIEPLEKAAAKKGKIVMDEREIEEEIDFEAI